MLTFSVYPSASLSICSPTPQSHTNTLCIKLLMDPGKFRAYTWWHGKISRFSGHTQVHRGIRGYKCHQMPIYARIIHACACIHVYTYTYYSLSLSVSHSLSLPLSLHRMCATFITKMQHVSGTTSSEHQWTKKLAAVLCVCFFAVKLGLCLQTIIYK